MEDSQSLRRGYDPVFLGDAHPVKLPNVDIDYQNDVLFKEGLRDQHVVDYIHYSLVMSKANRQALFSAANLDQVAYQQVEGRRWFIDDRIGGDYQIGNEVYADNPWDKGHLTRRTAVTWDSPDIARKASHDSCSYANASLQHENFNQDEWRLPEKMVQYFDRAREGRLSIFTGPVFTETDRWYTPRDRAIEPARIPSAFWKVVCYVGNQRMELECQAYLLYQDQLFLKDKRGHFDVDISNYQVTITEIERLTGLNFPRVLYNSNPLFYFPRNKVNDGPEAFKMPSGNDEKALKQGVVFTRADTENKAMLARKREGRSLP